MYDIIIDMDLMMALGIYVNTGKKSLLSRKMPRFLYRNAVD